LHDLKKKISGKCTAYFAFEIIDRDNIKEKVRWVHVKFVGIKVALLWQNKKLFLEICQERRAYYE